jgi:DNA-directed RNA polymerase specialized sigma24 family protein
MLDLFYVEGRSRGETAAASGMSGDGVKSGLRRLRAQLARCIGRRLGLDPGTEP